MFINNDLVMHCSELQADVESLHRGFQGTREAIERRVDVIGSIIVNNEESYVAPGYSALFQTVLQVLAAVDSPKVVKLAQLIKEIQYKAHLRRMASEPRLLAEWLNANQNEVLIQESDFPYNREKVLWAFDALQRSKEFDTEVSKLAVSSLRLIDISEVRSLFKDPELKAMAFGHLINAKSIPIEECKMSVQELKLVAPYLTYVDCRGVEFTNDAEAQEFVKSCSNAHRLFIDYFGITELKLSSSKLQMIDCTGCTSLKKLVLSNLLLLRMLRCQNCDALKELNLCNLPLLDTVYSTSCFSLETVALSNLSSLYQLHLNSCDSLKGFALNDFPSLQKLEFSYCAALSGCALSNLPVLKELHANSCKVLINLFLTNLPKLKELYCFNCDSLEKIISDGLPSCSRIDMEYCSKLKSLPQLAIGAKVNS